MGGGREEGGRRERKEEGRERREGTSDLRAPESEKICEALPKMTDPIREPPHSSVLSTIWGEGRKRDIR